MECLQHIPIKNVDSQKENILESYVPEHLTISLTIKDVNKILASIQDLIFDHKIDLDNLVLEMNNSSISYDVLQTVVNMCVDPDTAAQKVNNCYDVEIVGCFIYAVLKTLSAFLERQTKSYQKHSQLILQRFFSKQQYESDEDYFNDIGMNQSNFAKQKKAALIPFTKRLNAEFNTLIKELNEGKKEKPKISRFSRFRPVHTLLLKNKDLNYCKQMLSGTIFELQ